MYCLISLGENLRIIFLTNLYKGAPHLFFIPLYLKYSLFHGFYLFLNTFKTSILVFKSPFFRIFLTIFINSIQDTNSNLLNKVVLMISLISLCLCTVQWYELDVLNNNKSYRFIWFYNKHHCISLPIVLPIFTIFLKHDFHFSKWRSRIPSLLLESHPKSFLTYLRVTANQRLLTLMQKSLISHTAQTLKIVMSITRHLQVPANLFPHSACYSSSKFRSNAISSMKPSQPLLQCGALLLQPIAYTYHHFNT